MLARQGSTRKRRTEQENGNFSQRESKKEAALQDSLVQEELNRREDNLIKEPDLRVRGHLVLGKEINSFPCNGTADACKWVEQGYHEIGWCPIEMIDLRCCKDTRISHRMHVLYFVTQILNNWATQYRIIA